MTRIMDSPILGTAEWYYAGMPPVDLEFFDRYIRPTLESISLLGNTPEDRQAKRELIQFKQELDWTIIGFMTGKSLKSPMYDNKTKDARENKDFRFGYEIGRNYKLKTQDPKKTIEILVKL